MKEITGYTKVFFIIADPIHHVQTPQMLNKVFAKYQFDGVVVPLHIPKQSLADTMTFFKGLKNFGGCVVTVPHKMDVLQYCEHLTKEASMMGAANVFRKNEDGSLEAHMLDGEGFIRGLKGYNHSVKNKSVYLAGAGGAANALAFALLNEGVAKLTIGNRTQQKAEDLRDKLLKVNSSFDIHIGTGDVSGHDVVVNATSLGLKDGDALPLDVDTLDASQLVCEIIMQPKETALLKAALQKGCQVHYGTPMLEGQVELMAEFFGASKDE